MPDQGTYDALINAALSGVDLKFMMTGWVDKKLPFWAAQTYYEPLLRAGGRIFQYTGGFFHAKTIAVDSAVCAVGTMNMDIRSLQLHKEVMEWIYDAADHRSARGDLRPRPRAVPRDHPRRRPRRRAGHRLSQLGGAAVLGADLTGRRERCNCSSCVTASPNHGRPGRATMASGR